MYWSVYFHYCIQLRHDDDKISESVLINKCLNRTNTRPQATYGEITTMLQELCSFSSIS